MLKVRPCNLSHKQSVQQELVFTCGKPRRSMYGKPPPSVRVIYVMVVLMGHFGCRSGLVVPGLTCGRLCQVVSERLFNGLAV